MSTGALRKVIERIEADDIPPSLDELAAISGLSKRHLTRSFRQSTGQTILEKINESRFNRARLKILSREKSLSEVANMSGYGSIASFSQAYKKWFGESPTRHCMK
jgi:AraC family transcriptional regulator